MKINWQKISFGFLGTLVFVVLGMIGSHVALALDYTPLVPLPGITGTATSNLPEYLVALFRVTLGLAAVLAVIQITIGGVEYMSTDAISGKEDGKERITQAIYGLILAIGAWLILNTVNPRILTFSFEPTPIEAPRIATTTPGSLNVSTFQKTMTCLSTNHTAQQYKTSLATYSFDSNNQSAARVALSQCTQFPPVTEQGPIQRTPNAGECSPDYNWVVFACEKNPTLSPPIQGPQTPTGTQFFNIVKEVRCKQKTTGLITKRELNEYPYTSLEQNGRERAMNACVGDQPSVGQDIFPTHCPADAQSETIICVDGPTQ